MKPEIRFTPVALARLECRDAGDGQWELFGYPIVFNKLSQNLGGFVERIDPGAVTRTIEEHKDIYSLYGHNSERVLGAVANGTLELRIDDEGVFQRTLLNKDDPDAVSVRAKVKRGDVRFMSFSFDTIGEDESWWSLTDAGFPMRTIKQMRLYEVSAVTWPAYTDTSVQARGAFDHLATIAACEPARLIELAQQNNLRSLPIFGAEPTGPETNPPGERLDRGMNLACDLAEFGIDPSFLTVTTEKE